MPRGIWPEPTADETESGGELYPTAGRRVVTQPYDFAVRSLADQIRDGSLVLQDVYQRNFIWDRARSSRLIESLLLNIPIPVVYFVEDETSILTVVDGHQRLKSIFDFVEGNLRLRGLRVLTDLNGKTFQEIDRKDQRTVLSRTVRCIVIMKESDPDIRFEVFERLNTGAVSLNAQEIRNCIYRGEFNQMLRRLVEAPNWLRILRKSRKDHRMRDCELILRFFTLKDRLEIYRPPMKSFLNDFMRDNRDPSQQDVLTFEDLFEETITKVDRVFGQNAFRRWDGQAWESNLNRAVFDTVMLCLSSAPPNEIESSREQIKDALKELCEEDSGFLDAISRATGDKLRLFTRIQAFGNAVSSLGISVGVMRRVPRQFATASG